MCSASACPSWYAIRTKTCQEDRAVNNLNAWGVETFFPRFSSSLRSDLPRPLFPGYIFARFDINAMLHNVSFTRGILHVVSFGGVPAPITEDVMSVIRCRVDEKGCVREHWEFKPGDEVVIRTGPLRNLLGTFEKHLDGHERVRILLKTISYTASVETSKFDLKLRVDR